MIRHRVLDVFVKEDDAILQGTFRCFIETMKQEHKLQIIFKDIEIKKTGYIRHRLILRYDTAYISIENLDKIIKDFYPNYKQDEQTNQTRKNR